MTDLQKASQKAQEFRKREEEILERAQELFIAHGEDKVTGRAAFAADFTLPGLLQGAVLRTASGRGASFHGGARLRRALGGLRDVGR